MVREQEGMIMDVPRTPQEIENTIWRQIGKNPEVTALVVKDDLLQVHVTDEMFRKLAMDRERGRKIILMLMQSMKTLTGFPEVTVRVYCNKEKVIEGKAKPYGGDNVAYMYDL